MMTVSGGTLEQVPWTPRGVPEVYRETSTMGLRGFGPKREIVDVTSALSCSEIRLLNVFKRLDARAGQSVAASLLWVNWRMFGDEAEIWRTVERLKHRRFIAAGDGRWGLCLTDAGFASLASL
jgi:hypothetical protein